jgi:hypothetical protein
MALRQATMIDHKGDRMPARDERWRLFIGAWSTWPTGQTERTDTDVTYTGEEAWASAVLRLQDRLHEYRDSPGTCGDCRAMAGVAADQLDLGIMHHAADHPVIHIAVSESLFLLHPAEIFGRPWSMWPPVRS